MDRDIVTAPVVEVIGYTKPDVIGMNNYLEQLHPDLNEDHVVSKLLGDMVDTEESGLINPDEIIEFAGRFCYRSFYKGRETKEYIRNILNEGHGSITEQFDINFAIAGVSRTLTHELIRHRLISPSQESQRYVDAKDIRLVVPPLMLSKRPDYWCNYYRTLCDWSRNTYEAVAKEAENDLPDDCTTREKVKRVREAARSVLPGCAETRLVAKWNMRHMRHLLQMRGSEHADLEIRRFAVTVFLKYLDVVSNDSVLLEDFSIQQDARFGIATVQSERGAV